MVSQVLSAGFPGYLHGFCVLVVLRDADRVGALTLRAVPPTAGPVSTGGFYCLRSDETDIECPVCSHGIPRMLVSKRSSDVSQRPTCHSGGSSAV